MKSSPRKTMRKLRQGAAVVEFAVCVPIIVLVVLGSIQAASMLFLRQAMVQSAYEGAKVAILREATNEQANTAIDEVLQGRRLDGVDVQFEPSDVESAVPGDLITVTVSAPGDANSFLPLGAFKNRTVSAKAVMVKE